MTAERLQPGDLRHTVEVTTDGDVLRARDVVRVIGLALDATDATILRLVACTGSLAQDLLVAGGGHLVLAAAPGGNLTVRCSPLAAGAPPTAETTDVVRVPEPVSWASSAPAVALLMARTTLGDDGPTRVWSRSTPRSTRRVGSCGRPARRRPGSCATSATSCARPATRSSDCPGCCWTPRQRRS